MSNIRVRILEAIKHRLFWQSGCRSDQPNTQGRSAPGKLGPVGIEYHKVRHYWYEVPTKSSISRLAMLFLVLVVFSPQILCGCIVVYQKFISPYKGFRCAHAALHESLSCSEYGKRSIQQHGVIEGVFLLKARFEGCSLAADEMKRHNISADSQTVNSIALFEPPQGGKPIESKQILGEPDPVTEPQPSMLSDSFPGENDFGDLPQDAEPSCSESCDDCSKAADSCSELSDSCQECAIGIQYIVYGCFFLFLFLLFSD
jgi:putative component of membrane protein insertase Oxa1/YidC/SpoIIIJ protein YidD